jgi:hypothetical protein
MKKVCLSLLLAFLMQFPNTLSAQTADTSAGTTITSTGWYRIAVNGAMVAGSAGGTRAAARFILRDIMSSWHQNVEFLASVQFGNRPSIVVLNNSYYSPTPAFTKIRLVEASTYDGAAIEVFVAAANAIPTAYIKDNVQIYGWNIVPWTKITGLTGDQDGIPTGFTARVINLTELTTGFSTANGSIYQFNNGRFNINDPAATTGVLNINTTAGYDLAFTGSGSANIYSVGDLYLLPAAGKALRFGSSGVDDRAILDVNGNFGIGTTDTKGYKLAVNGNAIFTKVKVKAFAGWPDYVFDEGYPLTSLKALGDFVRSEKHLPGIPSASEIAENGQDIGEINMQLVKKVEELTLYLLDHNKKIDLLLEKVEALEKENKALRQGRPASH